MKTTFQQAFDEIVAQGGPTAYQKYEEWSNDQRYRGSVVPFVKSLTHEQLFAIDRRAFDAVKAVIESDEREHALYRVRKSDDQSETKNLNVSWAFVHLFHKYIEEERRLPTWLEWHAWLSTSARELFAVPAARELRFKELTRDRKDAIRRGLRWRLGNAYYSCMRELDVLIRLRDEHGIDVRYHVLADALYRVDYWLGRTTMSLFINNAEMRSPQSGGRKERPSKYLASPPMINREAVMEKQHSYGNLHLATDSTIRQIVTAFRTSR